MDLHSIMYALTQLALEMEGVIWKIMMQLAIMMVMIAALMLIELVTVSVMTKIEMKSVNMIGWIAAKTANQLEIGFAMLKTIMNTVILMEGIVVSILGLEMVYVTDTTIIHFVAPMIMVIAVLMTQLQTTVLIANVMKMEYQSGM